MSFGDDMHDAPPDPLAGWPAFAAAVRARIERGREAFGDRSFARPPGELVGEIREEIWDLCAWSYILATRLDGIGSAIGERRDESVADAAPAQPRGPSGERRSVPLGGFTPEVLALLGQLCERLQAPPGRVVGMALGALLAQLDRQKRKPQRTRLLEAPQAQTERLLVEGIAGLHEATEEQ